MSKSVKIVLSEGLLAKLEAAAELRGVSRSEWMRDAFWAQVLAEAEPLTAEEGETEVPGLVEASPEAEPGPVPEMTPPPISAVNDHTGHRVDAREDGAIVCLDCNRLVR